MITRTNFTTTPDATPFALFVFPLVNNTGYYLTGQITALSLATEGHAAYTLEATAKRTTVAGSVLETQTVTPVFEDDPTWDVTVTLVGNDIVVSVIGDGTPNDVNWYGELNHIQVVGQSGG